MLVSLQTSLNRVAPTNTKPYDRTGPATRFLGSTCLDLC